MLQRNFKIPRGKYAVVKGAAHHMRVNLHPLLDGCFSEIGLRYESTGYAFSTDTSYFSNWRDLYNSLTSFGIRTMYAELRDLPKNWEEKIENAYEEDAEFYDDGPDMCRFSDADQGL